MSVQTSYAKALLEAAQETGLKSADLDRIEKELTEFASTVEGSKNLQAALNSPVVTAPEKAELATELSKKLGYSDLTSRFIALTARKNRSQLFSEIANAFTQARLEAEGAVLGTVVSADELKQADLEELATAFTKRLGKKVVFKAKTDSNLLAGLKVTVNGVTYDGSLRSQLYQLRDRLVYGRA